MADGRLDELVDAVIIGQAAAEASSLLAAANLPAGDSAAGFAVVTIRPRATTSAGLDCWLVRSATPYVSVHRPGTLVLSGTLDGPYGGKASWGATINLANPAEHQIAARITRAPRSRDTEEGAGSGIFDEYQLTIGIEVVVKESPALVRRYLAQRSSLASLSKATLSTELIGMANRAARTAASSNLDLRDEYACNFLLEATRLLGLWCDPSTRQPVLLVSAVLRGGKRSAQDQIDRYELGVTRHTRRVAGGARAARQTQLAARPTMVSLTGTEHVPGMDATVTVVDDAHEWGDWAAAQLPEIRAVVRRHRRVIDWSRLPSSVGAQTVAA